MGVGTERDAECSGESKVGELEVALLVDEQVLGLEVAVQDAMRVKVVHSLDELVRLRCQSAGGGREELTNFCAAVSRVQSGAVDSP